MSSGVTIGDVCCLLSFECTFFYLFLLNFYHEHVIVTKQKAKAKSVISGRKAL